jgi:hypothetical protein
LELKESLDFFHFKRVCDSSEEVDIYKGRECFGGEKEGVRDKEITRNRNMGT